MDKGLMHRIRLSKRPKAKNVKGTTGQGEYEKGGLGKMENTGHAKKGKHIWG